MSIYAVADLHLSFNSPKPMNIFGEEWTNHEEKIKKDWIEKVNKEDTVLLPGDFSWGMKMSDTYEDFKYLASLPGRKIMIKGNHDYWWDSLSKLHRFMEENNFKNIDFLHNNSFEVEGHIIAGTRGWQYQEDEESVKKINREVKRLELSIKDGIQKYGEEKPIIICMHYPPTTKYLREKSDFIELMSKYNVKKCIYGHLHGEAHNEAVEGNFGGIDIQLVSSDYLKFKLALVV